MAARRFAPVDFGELPERDGGRRLARMFIAALALALVCAGAFALGRAGRDASQPGRPPFSPFRGSSDAAIAGIGAVPPIAELSQREALEIRARAAAAEERALAAARAASGSFTTKGSPSTTATASAPATEEPPLPSTGAVTPRTVGESEPVTPSPGVESQEPDSSEGGANTSGEGEGSSGSSRNRSSGSFDSSG
jgi:hypothetical protein